MNRFSVWNTVQRDIFVRCKIWCFSRADRRRENDKLPLVFHMQNYWWVWFPRNEMRVLEPTNISAEGSKAIAKISLYTVVPKLVQGIA